MSVFQGRTGLYSSTSICIVVPTYNEADNVPQLITGIEALGISDLTLVLVDDNSPDGTADLAESVGKNSDICVYVLRGRSKSGLGTAYVKGFRWVLEREFNVIIQMDADLSHSPEYIPKMLQLLDKYQVVVGSRYITNGVVDEDWHWTRKFISWIGNYAIRKIAYLQINDVTSGFKAYRRSALSCIDFDLARCKGFGFQSEIAYICQLMGLKIVELPIIFSDRQLGTSKMSLGIIMEAVVKMIYIRVKLRRAPP